MIALIYTMKYLSKIFLSWAGSISAVKVSRFQNTPVSPLLFQSFRGSLEFRSEDNTRNSEGEKQN